MERQLILALVILLPFGASAQQKKPKPPKGAEDNQSRFRNRYCMRNEKVGMELKNISRPGLSKFVVLDPSTSEKLLQPFMEAAQQGRAGFDLRATRVWEIELPNGRWRLASIEFEADEKDSTFAFCSHSSVQKVGGREKPKELSAKCSPSMLGEERAPKGYEPYDLFDIDGDGSADVVLKEVAGFSQKLSAFKIGSSWDNILDDCSGGD